MSAKKNKSWKPKLFPAAQDDILLMVHPSYAPVVTMKELHTLSPLLTNRVLRNVTMFDNFTKAGWKLDFRTGRFYKP